MQTFKMSRTAPTGTLDGHGLTHKQVAEHLGITSQRVQQIEAKALRKLRREFARRGLRLEDLTESF